MRPWSTSSLDAAGERAEHVGGSPANVAIGPGPAGSRRRLRRLPRARRAGRADRRRTCDATGSRSCPRASATARPRRPSPPSTRTAPRPTSSTCTGTCRPSRCPRAPATCTPARSARSCSPGPRSVTAALRAVREHGTVSYDPNIRPGIMGDLDAVRGPGRGARRASATWSRPARTTSTSCMPASRAERGAWPRWVGLGAGARRRHPRRRRRGLPGRRRPDDVAARRPRAEQVVDTVGAGDSFMAGLVSGLRRRRPARGPGCARAAAQRDTGGGPAGGRPRPGHECSHGRQGRRLRPGLDEL